MLKMKQIFTKILIWSVVVEASGVEENRYDLRGNTLSLDKRGKEVATSSRVDEVEEDADEVEDDEQYNDNRGIQCFVGLVEVDFRITRNRC